MLDTFGNPVVNDNATSGEDSGKEIVDESICTGYAEALGAGAYTRTLFGSV